MRVVVASRIFSPEVAAAAFRLSALASELVRRGADVTVLTTTTQNQRASTRSPRLNVRRWPVIRDRSGYVRGYFQYLSFDVPLFFRLMFMRRPDVIVVEPPPTTGLVVGIVAFFRRVPYVYYAADIWSDAASSTGAPRLVVNVLASVESRVLKSSQVVLAVNDGVAERVAALAASAQVEIVGNGIDVSVFRPDGEQSVTGQYAIYAGTASEWQGADIFIRAWQAVAEEFPGARLVFLGQGSAWNGLQELASNLGLSTVEFRDSVPPAEAARWFRSATIGLVSLDPAAGYGFAFPTKIYASLACGTPVLYSGEGPATSLIRQEQLGHATSYDIDEVTRALMAAFKGPPSLGERTRIANWAAENVSLGRVARVAADAIFEAAASS